MTSKRFTVFARSKKRMSVSLSAMIIVEPGTLTPYELAQLKTLLADQLMIALAGLPHLHVPLSEIKVTR